ncbi:putative RNA-directed DNA polymerase from transposon X-element [Trichonephila clavipes]|nr:putative RNA-directed DNA polymerase from transposon X-element [Trichonephila clavipes]
MSGIHLEIQVNSHCGVFGDFNAPHNTWNCSHNSARGTQLKDFADLVDLEIIYPDTPTRYGYNSQNTLDIALTGNFNFPFTIASLAELSSDHNPVLLKFSFNTPIHQENPRAITTCWPSFMKHLNNNIHLENYTNVNNPIILENKISNLSDVVRSTRSTSSQPIRNTRHTYTPSHIRDLISRKTVLGNFFKPHLIQFTKQKQTDFKHKLSESSKNTHKTHGKLNLKLSTHKIIV